MSTAAGWYDDPTRAGRLRYWDGSIWTEWVSSDGQTTSDPLPGAAGRSPRSPRPPSRRPPSWRPPSWRRTPGIRGDPGPADPGPCRRARLRGVGDRSSASPGVSLLTRIGFGIAALAGIVSCFAAGKEASTQGPLTYTFGNDIIGIGIVIALVAVAGAVVPWFWGRAAAAGLVAAGIGFLTLVGIGARSGADRFVSGIDVSSKSGLT